LHDRYKASATLYFQRHLRELYRVEQAMTNSNLALHCGAFKANRDDLISVITPEATLTWIPIPHLEIVDAVLESSTNAGLTIKRELYGLSGKKDSTVYGRGCLG